MSRSLLVLAVLVAGASCADPWDGVRAGLESWANLNLDAKFALNVGDATGSLFTWTSHDGFSMHDTRMPGASLSKWPSAVMISGLVNDGIMSYDDKANKYLKWWATDPKDSRSRVTLRQLLSFTSGFTEDAETFCRSGFDTCAQQLYAKSTKYREPGTTWAYLSCHLQFAGAMAVAASGKDIQTLFKEYLYKPFNMTKTSWSGGSPNPSMAGGIVTTGDDFENLLSRLLKYEVLPKTVLDQMETDYSKAPVAPSGDGWFGHYGMGHWWECLGYGTPTERAALPKVCTDAHVQAGPGEFGYYPLLDRSGGGGAAGPKRQPYYMQVVLAEPDALSGVPEYLRLVVKPLVDQVLSGADPESVDRQPLLDQGAGLLTRDISYIQSELGNCTCSKAPNAAGEPWASLTAKLPADKRGVNRRDIASSGVGLLLRDIVGVQSKLGTCTCEGRGPAPAPGPSPPAPGPSPSHGGYKCYSAWGRKTCYPSRTGTMSKDDCTKSCK